MSQTEGRTDDTAAARLPEGQNPGALAPARARTRAVPAAVVQPAPGAGPGATAPDAHHGRGGLYTVKNGQRTLVERTGRPVAPH